MTTLLFGTILGVYLAVVAYEFGPLIKTRLSKSFTPEPTKLQRSNLRVTGAGPRYTIATPTKAKSHYSVKYLFTPSTNAVILKFRGGSSDKCREILETSSAKPSPETQGRQSSDKQTSDSETKTDSQK